MSASPEVAAHIAAEGGLLSRSVYPLNPPHEAPDRPLTVSDARLPAPLPALPRRTPKRLRAQMVRAELGGNPFQPSVVFYTNDVPALSWSDVGGIVPTRTTPRLQAIAAACFPMRHTPRVERRPEVLRRLLAALEQWPSASA
ncbi:hypothetical protein ACFO5K_10555 [Nocardia halotolerans]|uniref:Winged helix DNA-binding domain-containing protein n=1 Tax=Nocardia halotolerans TaxID=1755878 RepID=A0ABV8VG00_9NOCA